MDPRTVAVTTHGRFLVREGGGVGLLVGFHGYGENAAKHLAELEKIPNTAGWTLVAVQGLHRFYNVRTDEVVASWMTREDRDLAIADNVAYVGAVLDNVGRRHPLVFCGFSQGVPMAYRAAAAYGADGLLVHGGDLPDDVIAQESVQLPPAVIGRGTRDDWYTAEKLEKDLKSLPNARSVVFDGGHEWHDAFRAEAGALLQRLGRP